MNEYQKEYLDKAEKLAEECRQFFTAVTVAKRADSNADFYVVVVHNGNGYEVTRDYEGNVNVRLPYRHFANVSSSTQGQVHKSIHTSKKMKVMTARKMEEKMQECLTVRAELERMDAEAIEKVRKFLEEVDKTKLKVSYRYDSSTNGIAGGSIIRGGLEFEFTIHQDGYISQKISKDYRPSDNLDTFIRMSDNKYTELNEK